MQHNGERTYMLPLSHTCSSPPPPPDMEPLLCAPSKVRAVTHLLHVVNVILQVPDAAPCEGDGKILEGGRVKGSKGVTLQVPDAAPCEGEGSTWRGRGGGGSFHQRCGRCLEGGMEGGGGIILQVYQTGPHHPHVGAAGGKRLRAVGEE